MTRRLNIMKTASHDGTSDAASLRAVDAASRPQAQQITWILKLPMKGTINAIMDEEVECFPRELDLRIEARHLKKQRLYQKRHGLDIAIPVVVDELSQFIGAHTNVPDGYYHGQLRRLRSRRATESD